MPKNAVAVSAHKREERRKRVASMYVKGVQQWEIAFELGVTQGTISKDLKVIRTRWAESGIRDYDKSVERELRKIDELEREYWDAWDASKLPRQTETQRAVRRGDGEEQGQALIAEKTLRTESLYGGDAKFLAGVERCIAQRCKILGLEAPKRAELTGARGGSIKVETSDKPDLKKLSTDDLRNLIAIIGQMEPSTASE